MNYLKEMKREVEKERKKKERFWLVLEEERKYEMDV